MAFDDHRGLGTLEGATGERYEFHCTAIEDSRAIEVGTPVLFDVVPGHLGEFEATALRP